MNERFLRLARRLADELSELEQVVKRAQEGWRRVQQSSDDFYLDSVALNLHGFYAGLERLFELIATTIGTHEVLDGYRGFRHVVRNVYTLQFDMGLVIAVLAQAQKGSAL
ncbi:MAG TPA: hypothetical protein ENI60_01445 [Candidatus Fraserbacteria bacterium]|nr:hypothetical protein [Candidatus Fraserbacteria bacterium]